MPIATGVTAAGDSHFPPLIDVLSPKAKSPFRSGLGGLGEPDGPRTPRAGTSGNAVYTPGGTRVPEGPPPLTPPRSVSFGPTTTVPLPPSPIPGPPPLPWDPSEVGKSEEPSKLVQTLPLLEVTEGSAEASVATGDWMARIGPLMRSLSPGAPEWWSRVVSTATEYYHQWLKSDSLRRLTIKSDVVAQGALLEYGSLRRVEERGSVLVLQALPPALQSEAVSVRALGTVPLLFLAMTKYQPGGTGEKSAILSFLTQPQLEGGNGVQSNHAALRKWERLYRRCVELGLAPPDPTLLVRALDGLGKAIGNKSPHIAFRLATFRHQYQLDAIPNETSVLQYCQLLIAEAEAWMIAASAGGEPSKHPRVAAMDPAAPPENPKKPPAGKAKGGNKGEKGKGEGGPLTAEGNCKFFMSDGGCRYGKPCIHPHPTLTPSEGKCFNCGAVDHGMTECPRPKSTSTPSPGKGKGKENSPKKPPQPSSPAAEPKAPAVAPRKSPKGRKLEGAPAVEGAESEARVAALQATSGSDGAKVLSVAASLKGIEEHKPRGLIDGGATHNLRYAGPNEYRKARPVTVKLASGEAHDLRISAVGTLLSPNPAVQPIVAMGLCTRLLGCKVVWEGSQCWIVHPSSGTLDVTMVDDCPEVESSVCLNLIQQIEEVRGKLMLKALRPVEPGSAEWVQASGEEFFEGIRDWVRAQWTDESVNAEHIIPKESFDIHDLKLNRHARRRIKRGHVVVCVGADVSQWRFRGSQQVVKLSSEVNGGFRNEALYKYLLRCAGDGLITGLIGDMSHQKDEQVRCITLAEVAQQGLRRTSDTSQQCMLVLKYPEGSPLTQDPGLGQIVKTWALKNVSFDLGALDGTHQEPTHVITNSGSIWETFDEVRAPNGSIWAPTKSHHEVKKWPKALCTAVHLAMSEWQRGPEYLEKEDNMRIARLQHLFAIGCEPGYPDETCLLRPLKTKSKEMFRRHCLAGHRPWRPDCAACVDSMAHVRPHRRLKFSRVCGMNVDISGPHRTQKAEDQDVACPRYFIVCNYSFPLFQHPISQTEKEDVPQDVPIPDEFEEEPPEDAVPGVGGVVDGEDWEIAEEPDERGDDWIDEARVKDENKKWETIIATCKEPTYKVLNIPLLEILPSKSPQAIISALNRFYAKLRSWGLPVFRLHSDHAPALTHKSVSDWATHRGIHKTTSLPEQPAGIGKAEMLVKAIKAQVRALLFSANAPALLWPHAARYACASL